MDDENIVNELSAIGQSLQDIFHILEDIADSLRKAVGKGEQKPNEWNYE